jgi:MarR family 2-MHQ and catechol resistance regulon transcriptional repressor
MVPAQTGPSTPGDRRPTRIECFMDERLMHKPGVRQASEADLYYDFVTAYQDVMRWVNELMSQHGITLAQYGVLRNLENGEEVRLSDLSQRLVCTNSNVTRLIDFLSREGLVKRIEDREDRRVTRVRLTDSGRQLRDEITPQYQAYVGSLTAGFSNVERAAFTGLLAKLRGRAGKPARAPVAD